MPTRRSFAYGIFAAAVIPSVVPDVAAQVKDKGLPGGIGSKRDYLGPVPPPINLGNQPPSSQAQKTAQLIIEKAPSKPTPMAIAQFFQDVANGEYELGWKPFTQGWPTQWNPLIVEFFHSTNYGQPDGDLTPWCAAFINWCYRRCNRIPATNSASSASFRTFGEATSTPRLGDIVVFKSTNPDDAAKGHGHVGFYVNRTSNAVTVLGGNQIHAGIHKISAKSLPIQGNSLILHSFRTDPRLHESA